MRDPDTHVTDARSELADAIGQASSAQEVAALLRRFKRRMALLAASPILAGSGRRRARFMR